jgi:hypothetical protein
MGPGPGKHAPGTSNLLSTVKLVVPSPPRYLRYDVRVSEITSWVGIHISAPTPSLSSDLQLGHTFYQLKYSSTKKTIHQSLYYKF